MGVGENSKSTMILAVSPERSFDSEALVQQGYSQKYVQKALYLQKLSPQEILEENKTVLKGICTTTETAIAQLNIAVAQIVMGIKFNNMGPVLTLIGIMNNTGLGTKISVCAANNIAFHHAKWGNLKLAECYRLRAQEMERED